MDRYWHVPIQEENQNDIHNSIDTRYDSIRSWNRVKKQGCYLVEYPVHQIAMINP